MKYTTEKILDLRKEEAKTHGKWRKEAREDFEFRDGDQWADDDKALLEEQNRPIVVFNRIGPIIDAITGNEINNRQDIKYLPRTIEDTGINEMYSSAASWVRDECNAEDEESDVYNDGVTCGMAWGEWYVDYDEDPEGKITFIRVPPLQMRWDANARRKNLADRTWDMREQWMENSEIEARWPKADTEGSGDDERDTETLQPHDATDAWKYDDDSQEYWQSDKKDKSLVIHFQWREREDFWRVGDPQTGRVVEFDKNKYKKIEKYILEKKIPNVRLSRWKYREKFILGSQTLEERDVATNCFTRVPLTAKREESTNLWYGVVRAMKDPQRWANKFFSQIMHIFNANPKGGLILETDAVSDHADFEKKWADPSGIAYVNDGAITSGKIKEKPMSGYPSSLDKMLNFAISSIRDVSGMNVEMLGLADREQAGVLEQERKKAALVILAPLAAAMYHHRKVSGKVLLAFMRKYLSENSLVRMTSQGQARYVPFVKDDESVKYDVIIDTAPSSPNMKQEVWGTMTQILPGLIKAGVPVPPALLDFSPLPESVIAEWKTYIEQNKGADPQVQQLQQELQRLTEENKMLMDKRAVHEGNMKMKMEELSVEKYISDQKILLDKRNKDLEMAMKKDISDNELKVKILEISKEYDTEMAKIREKAEVEKNPFKSTDFINQMLEKMGDATKISSDMVMMKEREGNNAVLQLGQFVAELGNKLNAKIDSDNQMREKILKSIEGMG